MRRRSLWAFVLTAGAACAGASPRPQQPAAAEASKGVDRADPAPEHVEFASGALRLRGLL